jgi:hypothetical protein
VLSSSRRFSRAYASYARSDVFLYGRSLSGLPFTSRTVLDETSEVGGLGFRLSPLVRLWYPRIGTIERSKRTNELCSASFLAIPSILNKTRALRGHRHINKLPECTDLTLDRVVLGDNYLERKRGSCGRIWYCGAGFEAKSECGGGLCGLSG